MFKDETNEFSFVLRPSPHGVGVYATHDILSGTHLRLFSDEKEFENRIRKMNKAEIPEDLLIYCMAREDHYLCPPDFGAMPIGWYLNHSSSPNAVIGYSKQKHSKYQWYSLRDINQGEEILIDYNSLEEPENQKESYYRP